MDRPSSRARLPHGAEADHDERPRSHDRHPPRRRELARPATWRRRRSSAGAAIPTGGAGGCGVRHGQTVRVRRSAVAATQSLADTLTDVPSTTVTRAAERAVRSSRSSFRCGTKQDYIERALARRSPTSATGCVDGRRDRRLRADRRRRRVDRRHAARSPTRWPPPIAHVRVVHHPKSTASSAGRSRPGFAAATGDLVLYTDADLPFDMAELHKAVRLLRYYDADIVVGVPLRPHRRGLVAGGLHVRLQPPDPPAVRRAHARTSTSPSSSAGAGSSTTSSCAARARSSTPS